MQKSMYERTPAFAVTRPDLSEALDLPLTVIVSQSLHLCSMASYRARKELIFSASNCLKRL